MSSQNGGVPNGPTTGHITQQQSAEDITPASANEVEDTSESGPGELTIRERTVTYLTETESVHIDVVSPDERTDESPISALDLFLAGTLIIDVWHSRNGHFKHGEQELRLYHLYNHWVLRWTIYIFIIIIHGLALFEEPAVPSLALPYWATMMIELACLTAFICRLIHAKMFTSGLKWWSDLKNLITIGTIALMFLDMILYIALIESGIHTVRWSRMLRPLLMINVSEGRQIRRAFRNIRRTLPDIIIVLILFFILIALFALMALKMFENRMPAYDQNYWFSLFFICYLIICMYIFMSVILAVIYNNYRKHLKTEVQKSVFQRRRTLNVAFDILKIQIHGVYVVTKMKFDAVMRIVTPLASTERIDLLWSVLDENSNGFVNKREFLRMHDLLNVPLLEEEDQMTFMESHWPSCYLSKPSLWFQRIVLHRAFIWVFDGLIVLNAIFIALSIEESDWFFLTVFSLEIIAKMYVLGVKEFFRRDWNKFDFIVIFAAVVFSIVELAVTDDIQLVEQTLDTLFVLRVLRLFKPLGSVTQFQVFILTLNNILPSLVTYGGVIFVFYYIFAILGMELYAGLFDYYGYPDENGIMPEDKPLYCGNDKLNGSDFWNMHLLLASAYVLTTSKWARLFFVFFHLTVVVILMNIFVAFVLEVFILRYSLNLSGSQQTAIQKKISEMGYQLDHNEQETLVKVQLQKEKRSKKRKKRKEDVDELVHNIEENETETEAETREHGLRFRLSKSGVKNVEVLLQQLFEYELDDDDAGPDIEDLEAMPRQEVRPSPLRLDNVT
ncbi:two pore channel protein 1-like [Glandiceps talaboti]